MEPWSALRWARAAGFATACAALAAAGHLYGGGTAGRGWLLGAPIVLALGFVLTSRRRTLRTIIPAVAAGQVVMHVLGGPAGTSPVPQHHGSGGAGLDMLLMHLIGVLVTAWWLERGERRLCSLVQRIVARALPAPSRPALPRTFVRMRIPPAPAAPARAMPVGRASVRRGPPAFAR